MSHVTNIILTTMVDEEEALVELNTKLSTVSICSTGGGCPLISCDERRGDGELAWYGGNKSLECGIHPAAYNFFKLDVFLEVLRSVKWDYPEDVQLFVKDQHDDHFAEVVVFPPTEAAKSEGQQ